MKGSSLWTSKVIFGTALLGEEQGGKALLPEPSKNTGREGERNRKKCDDMPRNAGKGLIGEQKEKQINKLVYCWEKKEI